MSGETHTLFDLTGKVAVVTGGGSGLGREFCDVLAEFGADVVCPDLYMERARETCEIIKKYGHTTLPLEVDVSRYELVKGMFQHVMDRFGKLDILVNNAGISTQSVTIDRIELDVWHKVIDVNLHGVFYCMREGLKIMVEKKAGSIINIASVLGLCVTDPAVLSVPPYVASKFAVVGLTKEAAAEYGRHGIRVNCIAPGFIHGTRLGQSRRVQPEKELPKEPPLDVASRTPLQRTGDPKELKGLLLYLASNSSSFVTGQIIAHDGGWTIW